VPGTCGCVSCSDMAGMLIGKAGAGLKTLRECGVTIELPRDDIGGQRVLTTQGSALSVCAAITAALNKLAGETPM